MHPLTFAVFSVLTILILVLFWATPRIPQRFRLVVRILGVGGVILLLLLFVFSIVLTLDLH